MKARFQADADFSQRIVSAVRRREPAIDFQSANVASLRSLSDPEVLSLAARDSRVLVSHDLTTMAQSFRQVRRDRHERWAARCAGSPQSDAPSWPVPD